MLAQSYKRKKPHWTRKVIWQVNKISIKSYQQFGILLAAVRRSTFFLKRENPTGIRYLFHRVFSYCDISQLQCGRPVVINRRYLTRFIYQFMFFLNPLLLVVSTNNQFFRSWFLNVEPCPKIILCKEWFYKNLCKHINCTNLRLT